MTWLLRCRHLTGEIIAVQVTKLPVDGKKADVAIPRITTGSLGLGAVRLDRAGGMFSALLKALRQH